MARKKEGTKRRTKGEKRAGEWTKTEKENRGWSLGSWLLNSSLHNDERERQEQKRKKNAREGTKKTGEKGVETEEDFRE